MALSVRARQVTSDPEGVTFLSPGSPVLRRTLGNKVKAPVDPNGVRFWPLIELHPVGVPDHGMIAPFPRVRSLRSRPWAKESDAVGVAAIESTRVSTPPPRFVPRDFARASRALDMTTSPSRRIRACCKPALRYATVHVSPELNRAFRSPSPFLALAASTCLPSSTSYFGASTSRKMPIGVGMAGYCIRERR
jgi:hypothetical protein